MEACKYKGISKNSKEIKEDYIYFCFEGKNSGYNYIEEAIQNGATKIVGEKPMEIENYEQVEDVNTAMIDYAMKIYDNPQDKLKLIGITGTDGKTSTALLIYSLLNKLSASSYIGTNGFQIKGKEVEYTDFTTPFADKIYKYFLDSLSEDCKYTTMEVSSHALDQNRLGDLEFEVALFTNLSQEHLEYHKTMEEYFMAKKKLFQKVSKTGKIIVNIDDKYGKILYEESNNNKISISLKDKGADFYASQIKLNSFGTSFNLHYKDDVYSIKTPLIAEFNIYNLTEAIACLVSLGFVIEDVIAQTNAIFIPGRLESIENDKGLNIIIDFAHTADAIRKVMEFIESVKKGGKVHVLTGSAGGRDHLKRPKMGEYAAKYADYLYLTEDDPRDESVEVINSDLKSGIVNEKCKIIEEPNRKKAIEKMISNAKSGDILVLFGKGTMKYMYYDGYKEKYIEKEEVLKKLKG